jgi:hypothetical protein
MPEDPSTEARLAPTRTVYLDNLRITVAGGRVDFEQKALRVWAQTKIHGAAALADSAVEAHVSERRLSVGVHNGRRFLFPPSIVHLQVDSTNDDALVFDGAPAFSGVPVDELCALVLELQLTMVCVEALPSEANDSHARREAKSECEPAAAPHHHTEVVTARWLPVFPFADGVLTPRAHTSTMLAGPKKTPGHCKVCFVRACT